MGSLFGGGGSSNSPSMAGADWSAMADAGYQVPSSDPSLYNNTVGGGGMNWAGLSSGLSNLSKSLGGSGSSGSGSNTLQTSPSVSSTVSGGTLQPAGAGGGASALASLNATRNQLAQYLLLAAMQGKGRGKSGGGLLG